MEAGITLCGGSTEVLKPFLAYKSSDPMNFPLFNIFLKSIENHQINNNNEHFFGCSQKYDEFESNTLIQIIKIIKETI